MILVFCVVVIWLFGFIRRFRVRLFFDRFESRLEWTGGGFFLIIYGSEFGLIRGFYRDFVGFVVGG